MYLISITVVSIIVSWFIIVITHIKFRRQKQREGVAEKIMFKSLFFPVADYICLLFLAGIVILMTQIEDMQLAVWLLPIWLLVIWLGYMAKKRFESKGKEPAAEVFQ